MFQSLKTSLTTLQSVPRSRPPGLTSTEITSNSAVFQWQQIPRKDAHGVLLGYIVDLYSYYSGRYRGEIKTSNTSIAFKDLSPANRYELKVRGYTAIGSGPNKYYYFST
ncbi:Down syndrome cell adhesion molecule-like protein 1 homolog, partial [Exaiptasia diaphana]|uniref:Fibronectin type-III domain-containing protein n=1 Tax=Exaiptasia diaphana TaxID=2652724 RepID=A0A913YUS1_EXADI